MPYPTQESLPDWVKELPEHAQDIWRKTWNSDYDKNKDEERAFKIAIAAVKRSYKKVGDKWIKITSEMTNKKVDKIKRECYTLELDKGFSESTNEIQIMPTGEWKHDQYGDIKIDSDDIESFKQHYEEGIRKDIPITAGHSQIGEELPAIGWFTKLINKGSEGLWGVVEWTEKGKELLKDKAFKYFSPEFHDEYEDPETHESYQNILVGGALTNKPYFKGLPQVTLSEFFSKLNNNSKMQKHNEEEEKKEGEEELTEEEKKKKEEELKAKKEEEKEDNEEEKEEEGEEEEEKEEKEEDTEKKEASENSIRINASEYNVLKNKAEQGYKAMQELKEKRFDEFVNKWQFSERGEKGAFLPKSKDKVKSFIRTLEDKQLKQFEEILSDMPKRELFSELGNDEEVSTPQVRLDKAVEKKMKENDKLNYSDAVKEVMSEDKELAKELSE